MSDISPSPIKVDAALEEKIRNSDFEQVKEILKDAAISQGLVYRDWDPQILKPVESPVLNGHVRTVVVNGVKHYIEGRTEQELLAAENEFYRQQFQQPVATTQPVEQPRGEDGRFASADDIAAKAELELAFKRGDIDTAAYLERSGAIDSYLAAQGVDMDSLREISNTRFTQSWADATSTFMARHGDWPGGDANRDLIGRILDENNLTNAEDKVGALEAAYNHARENGLLVTNPETEQARRIAQAQSPSELSAILELPRRQQLITESGLFNR